MIKLPEYQPRGQTAALPTPNVSARLSPDQIDGGMGKALGQIGQQFADIAIKEKDAADTTAVLEADRKLSQWQAGALYGENGALNRKGKDTLGLPDETSKAFDSYYSEVAAGLTSDKQRMALSKLSADRRESLMRTLYQHSSSEMERHYDGEFKASIDTARSAAALAYGDPKKVDEELQRGAKIIAANAVRKGLGEEARTAQLQQWSSTVHRDVVSRMLDENPMQAQQYLEQNRDKFTANDLLAVTHGVQAGVERVQERQRILADKRENDALSIVKQLESNSELGIPTSPATIVAAQNAVEGTSAKPMLAALLDRQKAMLEFSRLPPDQMKQQIEGLRGQLMNGGAADPSKAASLLRNMENLHSNLVTSLKNDPLKIYQDRSGQQLEPITPQQLMSGAAAQSLRARESALGAIKKKYGDGVADSVLRPEEADAMRKTFETGTPDQQLSVFKGLFPLSKAGYEAALRQIGGSDEMVFAGMHYMKGTRAIYEGGSSVPVASLVLDGMAKMKDKSFALPQPGTNGIDGMRVTFNNAIGNALPPGSPAREMAYKATQAIYASLASSTGKFGGVLEPSLLNSAIKFATGGITTVGNEKVLMPYGMKEEDFKDKLGQQIAAAAQRTRLPLASLSNAPLEAISPGRYAVKVGRNYAMGLDGSRLVLEVK